VAKPVIGSRFKDAFGLEFVWIPPGTFKMGSSKRGNDEKPIHDVTIREGFYMSRNEVTQGEWQSIMATSVIQQRDKTNPVGALRGVGDQYPMYYVSWTDAQEFIKRLNQKSTSYTYRLPTEAEWEYACRGGVADDYNGAPDETSWYANNSGRQRIDAAEIWRTDQINYVKRIVDNGNQTHPVGQKQPNGFGLYDMNGNVWEWCEDLYHWGYAGAPLDATAWLSNGEKDSRVLRGGSWDFNATFLSSTTRSGLAQETRGNYFGFRLVAVARSR
jgi:formylglycine-generating enzyme required for sulfatase activity